MIGGARTALMKGMVTSAGGVRTARWVWSKVSGKFTCSVLLF